jgi:hypothetical protein
MIGESVYSTSRTPKIVTFGGPLACILVVASYSMGMVGLRVFAILPAAMAVMSALSIRAAFKAEITKDALEVETGPIILFQQIQGLCIGGVCRNPTEILPAKSIQVFHAEGILEIPSKLNINHSELYRFLYSQLPTTGADHVHRDLRKHLDEQRDVFDQDQIFTFCARRSLATGIQGRYAAGQFFAILVTAIAWAIMGQSREVSDNFTAVAIALGIFGFAGMLISLLSSRGEGPERLARIQSDHQPERHRAKSRRHQGYPCLGRTTVGRSRTRLQRQSDVNVEPHQLWTHPQGRRRGDRCSRCLRLPDPNNPRPHAQVLAAVCLTLRKNCWVRHQVTEP